MDTRKLSLEIPGQLFDDGSTPAFLLFAADNHPSDVPVKADQLAVDGAEGLELAATRTAEMSGLPLHKYRLFELDRRRGQEKSILIVPIELY